MRFASVPCDVDPLAFVRAGAGRFADVRYFAVPGGPALGGLGVAWRARAAGGDRLERLRDETASLPDDQPLFVGFSFRDGGPDPEVWPGFPAAEAVAATATVARTPRGGRLFLAVAAGRDPGRVLDGLADLEAPGPPAPVAAGDHVVGSHPRPAAWRAEVAEAVAAIRAGSLEKVVLARSVVVGSPEPVDAFGLVGHLAAAYPQAYTFGWGTGTAAFVGASPELLVARRGATFRSNPLAGSAPRGEGAEEDRKLGASLLASGKDLVEHAFVVEDVAARLAPFAAGLEVPPAPSLRRMATVQHLSTEIRGTLARPTHLLDLAAALHPTPAVGGTPRPEAVAFIDKVEVVDRGWYTGGIGWARPDGDGDVALALRCALLQGGSARLFAGAGIVGGSDPEAELVETRLKFRPLLELLTAT